MWISIPQLKNFIFGKLWSALTLNICLECSRCTVVQKLHHHIIVFITYMLWLEQLNACFCKCTALSSNPSPTKSCRNPRKIREQFNKFLFIHLFHIIKWTHNDDNIIYIWHEMLKLYFIAIYNWTYRKQAYLGL
jgi:hypothetical protein